MGNAQSASKLVSFASPTDETLSGVATPTAPVPQVYEDPNWVHDMQAVQQIAVRTSQIGLFPSFVTTSVINSTQGHPPDALLHIS